MKESNPLDGQTPHQLVAEIRELSEQYRQEVTTARRTWPNSIRDRVTALYRLGVKCFRIAKLTGVPEPTVTSWCKPRGAQRALLSKRRVCATVGSPGCFLPAQVIQDSQTPTVRAAGSQIEGRARPVATSLHPDSPGPVIIVRFPNGIQVEGLRTEALIELCRGLGL